jgi:PEP-CTERM motif
VITGEYTNVEIKSGDVYSNGTNYAVTFSTGGYMLSLSTSDDSPLTYFGYYLPALDGGNQLEFLKDGVVVATINPAAVIANTGTCPNGANPYCGNPNGPFAGGNTGEPYAFINVYFSDGASFDAVRFFENPTVGGYESDNHTVGYFVTRGVVVPEPATWAMMIAGFGLVGFAARRRRTTAASVIA